MAAEIEILVQIAEGQRELLEYFDSNSKLVGRSCVKDRYFYDPTRSHLKPDSQNRLYQALRLREKDDRHFITHKVDHFDKEEKWTYSDELETEVKDGGVVSEILKALGVKALTTIDTTKSTYRYQKYEVIENVVGLGAFLEVEYKRVVSNDHMEIKAEILDLMNRLPCKYVRDFDGEKPELMIRKNGVEEVA
jgi:predicted adenylyl cyclase CyaB